MSEDSENIKKLTELLRSVSLDHQKEILKLSTFKEAHIYCLSSNISSQKYGPLLEKFFQEKFQYLKNDSKECTGDCRKEGKNYEIKVSLGGMTYSKYNYVQLRPSHDCDFYILTAYYLSEDNLRMEGELFVFRVPKEEIKKLIVSHGGYAHGTVKEHGEITLENLGKKEFAIRPRYGDNCWKELLNFRVLESEL